MSYKTQSLYQLEPNQVMVKRSPKKAAQNDTGTRSLAIVSETLTATKGMEITF